MGGEEQWRARGSLAAMGHGRGRGEAVKENDFNIYFNNNYMYIIKLGTHGRMVVEACAEGILLQPCLHGALDVGFIQAKTGLMECHHFGPKLLYGLLHRDDSSIRPTKHRAVLLPTRSKKKTSPRGLKPRF